MSDNRYILSDEEVEKALQEAPQEKDVKIVWQHLTMKQLGERDGFNLLMSGYLHKDAETVAMYNSLIADIMNEDNCKKTIAITRACILGFEVYKDYLQLKGALSEKTKDDLEAFNYQVEDVIEDKNKRYVKRLFERGKVEKAQQVAERHGLDFNQIVQSYTLPVDKKDKSPIIREWLEDYFADKDNNIPVGRIKEDIIKDEVINPNEWNLVKSIASTDGYSNCPTRGYWWPKEEKKVS